MADVAEQPTQLETQSDDTQHLNAIFGNIRGYKQEIANLKDLLAKAEAEIAQQRLELARLRRGEGITVLINGRSFSLGADGPVPFDPASLIAPDVRDDLSQKLTAFNALEGSTAFLTAGPRQHDQALADSYVLSKE